jgi:hypothetical protein
MTTTIQTTRKRKPVPLYTAKTDGTLIKKSDRKNVVADFIRTFGANEYHWTKTQLAVNRLAS